MPSKGGRFEVSMDGRAIFEKSKVGRHAEPGEILSKIAAGEKGANGGR